MMFEEEKERIKSDWFETIVYIDEKGNEKCFSVKKDAGKLGITGDFCAGELWIEGKDLELLKEKIDEWFVDFGDKEADG